MTWEERMAAKAAARQARADQEHPAEQIVQGWRDDAHAEALARVDYELGPRCPDCYEWTSAYGVSGLYFSWLHRWLPQPTWSWDLGISQTCHHACHQVPEEHYLVAMA